MFSNCIERLGHKKKAKNKKQKQNKATTSKQRKTVIYKDSSRNIFG